MAVARLLPGRDGAHAKPVVTAAILIATGVVALHLVGVRSFSHEAAPGAAPELDLPLWASLLAGGFLLLGVVAAWTCRSAQPGAAVGLAAATAGAALPVWASWTGPPTVVRSVALTAPALMAAGLAQIASRWAPGVPRLGNLALVSATAVVAVHVISYDPFTDLQCARLCRSTVGPWVEASPQMVVTVEDLLIVVAIVLGLVAVALGRALPPAVRTSTGFSLALVGSAVVAELTWRDTELWARTTSSWLPWALAPPACAVCVISAHASRTRRAVDALLRDLETGQPAGVHFAVPGEDRWVDASGREVPAGAHSAVLLYDEHGPSVRLGGRRRGQESTALSASRRLALANARLTALASARLAEVQEAQRRTVQRADTERHRIERDLHDGAQQTLVSAAFHLSAAASRIGGSAAITEAQEHVASALHGLRELTHGPVPAALLEEGIRTALGDLAVEAAGPVTVVTHGDDEPPAEVAVTAYLCARAFVRQAAPPEPCTVEIEIVESRVRLVGRSSSDLASALGDGMLDRVGALGGAVSSATNGREWSTEVWIPCGS